MSYSSEGTPKIAGKTTVAAKGTSTSNLYIKIADQGTGSLTGENVDPKLVKADILVDFAESMTRNINSESSNNLITAGEIDASWVYIQILLTNASVYVENAFFSGDHIGPITVYRNQIINGKFTVTDEREYTNCIITGLETSSIEEAGKNLDTLKVWFHYTERKRTLYPYDQKGQALGNLQSHINYPEGTLKAAGGGGGGAE